MTLPSGLLALCRFLRAHQRNHLNVRLLHITMGKNAMTEARGRSLQALELAGFVFILIKLLQPESESATSVFWIIFSSVSAPLHGSCFRVKPAPCGSASFYFGFAVVSKSRLLPNKFVNARPLRHTNFSGLH